MDMENSAEIVNENGDATQLDYIGWFIRHRDELDLRYKKLVDLLNLARDGKDVEPLDIDLASGDLMTLLRIASLDFEMTPFEAELAQVA
jgi:hypothetical protein